MMRPCYDPASAMLLPCYGMDCRCHGRVVWDQAPPPLGGAPDIWAVDYCPWRQQSKEWLAKARAARRKISSRRGVA